MKIKPVVILMVLMTVSPVWAGERPGPFCTDYRGAIVQWSEDLASPTLTEPDLTFRGVPVIRYNPSLLESLNSTARAFVLTRACGVQALGYVLTDPHDEYEGRSRSTLADCWAAGKLFYTGKASRDELDSLMNEINAMSREEGLKFPGPVRVVDFASCRLKDF